MVVTFTGLVSVILLISFTLIYLLSVHQMENSFFDLLKEKASLTAWKYFEKDEMTGQMYARILDRNLVSLPEASEIVLNSVEKRKVADSLSKFLSRQDLSALLLGNTIKFRIGDRQGVGIYYPDNQGNFVVLITAVNHFGNQYQKKLLETLAFIFLGGCFLIFFIGRIYATNLLHPISNILRNVKRISASNLHHRLIETNRNDELAELTRTFNEMLERLEHAFSMQKNFIHNASHELKNPLTAILGETEVALSRQRLPNDYIAVLGKVREEAERLNQLTRNLLSLAQADSDLTQFMDDEIRMDELIWELKDYFEKTQYSGRIEVQLLDLPEEAEKITLHGNSALLRIALLNIIDNACKFSESQMVRISLGTSQGIIHLNVTDRGIGIPEVDLQHLFQPFSRASNALSFKGSGIGLSLVGKIVSIHHGTIKIHSILGKGTTIEIKFPIDKEVK